MDLTVDTVVTGNALEVIQKFYEIDNTSGEFLKSVVEVLVATKQEKLELDGGIEFEFKDLNIRAEFTGDKLIVEILK